MTFPKLYDFPLTLFLLSQFSMTVNKTAVVYDFCMMTRSYFADSCLG